MKCEKCECEYAEVYGSGRFCGEKCARSFSTRASRKEINAKVSSKLKRIFLKPKNCEWCNQEFVSKNSKKRTCSQSCGMKLRYSDPEQRKITSSSVIGKTGGWRNFGGNGKKGTFEGFLYQSSWELEWIKSHLNNEIPFRRCHESFDYEFGGKIRKYFPDFYLIDTAEYVEVKGFASSKTDAKIEAVRNKGLSIRVDGRKEIEQMMKFNRRLS